MEWYLFWFPDVQIVTFFQKIEHVLKLCIITCRTVVSQVITGYLPSLILKLFLHLVPPVMIILSTIQGYVAHSRIEKSACTKLLWFTVWNIFFASALSGSALYRFNLVLEPKEIPSILTVAVPGQVNINSMTSQISCKDCIVVAFPGLWMKIYQLSVGFSRFDVHLCLMLMEKWFTKI